MRPLRPASFVDHGEGNVLRAAPVDVNVHRACLHALLKRIEPAFDVCSESVLEVQSVRPTRGYGEAPARSLQVSAGEVQVALPSKPKPPALDLRELTYVYDDIQRDNRMNILAL